MPILGRLVLWLICLVLTIKLITQKMPVQRQVVFQVVAATTFVLVIWLGYGRAVWASEQSAQLQGVLQSPASAATGPQIVVRLGDSSTTLVPQRAFDPTIGFAKDTAIKVERGPNGEVLFSTQVRDLKGNIIADVQQNHWLISPERSVSWDHNYSSNSLEVLDGRAHVVLQVVLLPNEVRIQGVWGQGGNGFFTEIAHCRDSNHGCMTIGRDVSVQTIIEPLFRYPSHDYWGQKSEPQS